MKKLSALVLASIMLFACSMTALAAAGSQSLNLNELFTESKDFNIQFSKGENSAGTKAWPGSGPAAQISSVTIEQVGFLNVAGHEGNVGILVRVMGHGRKIAEYDGAPVDYFDSESIILSGTLVDGWYLLYDCGTPTLGDHRFDITCISHNFPYTEMSAWATFTIE